MNDTEREKKELEVAEVQPVAEEINSKLGTDYVAKPSQIEPQMSCCRAPADRMPSAPSR